MAKDTSIHQSLHQPIHEPLRQQEPQIDVSSLSDDELIALVQTQEGGDIFDVAYRLAPDGMSYQWKRYEIHGQPDYSNVAELESKHWRSVPQERHDGRWMPHGTKGPIIFKGQILMEIPTRMLLAKELVRNRQARQEADGMHDRMLYTPPGSAPRDAHHRTKPVIKREMVQIDIQP